MSIQVEQDPSNLALKTRKYLCFISYRHADNQEDGRQWATWLQYQLETYEVPPELVGKTNERGEIIPASIFPVFRDEAELSTGNLTDRIYQALDNSKVLVVICSPNTVMSPHVDKEIRYFKSKRDEDSCMKLIHAVIIAGNPTELETTRYKCFPDSLRYAITNGEIDYNYQIEPLAADLRLPDGSQGWTNPEAYRGILKLQKKISHKEINLLVEEYRERSINAILRLIAGILGVPYGQLKERDKTYQLKKARIESAEQTTYLASLLLDKDPIKALREGLQALTVLESEDSILFTSSLKRLKPVFTSGRSARIGENIEQILPTFDGNNIVLLHSGGIIECIGLKSLSVKKRFTKVSLFSAPWGPNGVWRSIKCLDHWILFDMRNGQQGLQKFENIKDFITPDDESWWYPLASDNHPSGKVSVTMGWCFVTSINDKDEWSDVDSYVNFINLNDGTLSVSDDVYELISNEDACAPAAIIRENKGWYLYTRERNIFIGDSDLVSNCFFSSSQTYAVFFTSEQGVLCFNCTSAELAFELALEDTDATNLTFSADDRLILLQTPTVLRLLCVPELKELCFLRGDYSSIQKVEAVQGVPNSWKLISSFDTRILVYNEKKQLFFAQSIDPTCSLAVLETEELLLFNVKNSENIKLGSGHVAFFSNPQSNLFAVIQPKVDINLNNFDDAEKIDIHLLKKPEECIFSVERFEPKFGMGKGMIGMINTSRILLVWSFELQNATEPPFTDRYNCSTSIFDLETGGHLVYLYFAVNQAVESAGDDPILTYLRGESDEQKNDFAIYNNSLKKIIWNRNYSDPEVEHVEASAGHNGNVFVIAFKHEHGIICRVKDGTLLEKLSGVVLKVKFDIDNSGLFVIWYKDGRAELWKSNLEDVIFLSSLGLIVTDVLFVGPEPSILVHHADGRVYLLSYQWLALLAEEKISDLAILKKIRSHKHSPIRSRWWKKGYPRHFPFFS